MSHASLRDTRVVRPLRTGIIAVAISTVAAAAVLAGCSYSTRSSLEESGPASTAADPSTTSTPPTTAIEAANPLSADSLVHIRGVGDVAVGMTVSEASMAAGFPLVPAGAIADPSCYRVAPQGGIAGVSFVVAEGTIATVEIDGAPITTSSGAGVGDTEDEIKGLFPDRLQSEPRPEGGGNLLVFVPRSADDAGYRVVFVTDGEVVLRYRAGRLPEVGESDPCAS